LKKCAALAHSGWGIYLERTSREFRYGIFATSTEPLGLELEELVMSVNDPRFPVISISQLAANLVEVRGGSGQRLRCHLSASESGQQSPTEAVEGLVEVMTGDVAPKNREQVARHLRRELVKDLRSSHGTLIAVVSSKRAKMPKSLRDGVLLDPRIDFQQGIANYKAQPHALTMAKLQASGALLLGMLTSDGITVFRSDAAVIGYRAFVASSPRPQTEKVVGGARRRAFESMCGLLGKDLLAAFMRSQDGHAEFKRS